METRTTEKYSATKSERLLALLASEGYKPSIDEDEDILFKVEGKTFYIDPFENDVPFYQVVCIISVEGYNGTPDFLIEQAAIVEESFKAVKTQVFNSSEDSKKITGVGFFVEAFYFDFEHFAVALTRIISTINVAFHRYASLISGTNTDSQSEEDTVNLLE